MDELINTQFAASLPFIKLSGALLVGIIIGWEREHRENIPGMRLLPLVAVGSTLFTFYSGVTETGQLLNPQLAGGIVTGIGFLGAGMIARQYGTLTGVTTAATIWVTAALGIGLGLGYYLQVAMVTAAVMVILWFFPLVSRSSNHNLYYEVVASFDEAYSKALTRQFEENKLKVLRHALSRHGDTMTCAWFVNGNPEGHERIGNVLINDPQITDFTTRLSS